MTTFPSAPNHVRHQPQGLDELRKSTFFFRRQNWTHWLFSKSPKSSAHASGTWRHSHPAVTFLSGVSVVTSLNDTSAPRVREHLHSCLHLTNLCAKRKVLSLTKPKGKIYKMKSLGHYITISFICTQLNSFKYCYVTLCNNSNSTHS